MSRPIIAIPLNPSILIAEGAVDPLPPADASFDPSGEWDHAFLIIGSRGFQTEHYTVGRMRVRKHSIRQEGCSLQIEERVIGDRGTESRQDISVECLNDPWATPLNWTRRSVFFNPQGEPEADLVLEEKGRTAGGLVEIHRSGQVKRIRPQGAWTTQYNLMEAIQRRVSPDDASTGFDLLEDFSLLKPGHRLVRADTTTAELPGIGPRRLQRYAQLGYGILPFDYYLDEHQRLLFAISMNKTFVLSPTDHAVRVVDEELKRKRGAGRRS